MFFVPFVVLLALAIFVVLSLRGSVMTPHSSIESLVAVNLIAGWTAIGAGVVTGAVIGLFFHDEGWLGGYGSFQRRMLRLGHISFFGMGFLNVLFAVSLMHLPAVVRLASAASTAFIVAAVTMPLCCGLTAWRKPFRHLFPIPVVATLAAVALLLTGWVMR